MLPSIRAAIQLNATAAAAAVGRARSHLLQSSIHPLGMQPNVVVACLLSRIQIAITIAPETGFALISIWFCLQARLSSILEHFDLIQISRKTQ